MSRGELGWALAAGLHLAFALCGAAQMSLTGDGAFQAFLRHYGFASGTDGSFSFFAPAVASQCRARLAWRDADGGEWPALLLEDSSTVFGLRASSVLDSFPELEEPIRRGVAASWAGAVFGRHPVAEAVLVEVEIEMLPSMAEWRAGARATWKSIYKATFLRQRPAEHGVEGDVESARAQSQG